MAGFSFTATAATCDGTDLATLARAEGTPLYVYSRTLIERRYRALDTALAGHPHRIHYALKANSTRGLLEVLHAAGAGVDANSGGEIAVARCAGFEPHDIVFTGVGKSRAELEAAVAADLHAINAIYDALDEGRATDALVACRAALAGGSDPADAREAQRSYEANLKMFDQTRQMSSSLMELLRK